MLRKTFHFALKRRIGLNLIMYRPCKKDNYASHYLPSLKWSQSVLRLQLRKNWLEALTIYKLSSLLCLKLYLGTFTPVPLEINIMISPGSCIWFIESLSLPEMCLPVQPSAMIFQVLSFCYQSFKLVLESFSFKKNKS